MNRIRIATNEGKYTIRRHIYGHFSEHLGHCIYDGGYWVGEDSAIPNTRGIRNDLVDALRAVGIPNLRWPGGCFADEYHWQDGIGPKEKRPLMINTHWGGVTENNHFGTHEFLDLCGRLECAPYICGNLGSGTVREMAQWVEYLTFSGRSPMADLRRANGREEPWPVAYWGVGNENWGCGGNMKAEYYANEYRRYATYCRDYKPNQLYRIACGPADANYDWTETMMKNVPPWLMQGLSLHHYTIPYGWGGRGLATVFNEEDWFVTMRCGCYMNELVTKHSAVMDKYDPKRMVGLIVDEWGCWWNVEPGTNPGFLYQQNTLRDALVAGVILNIFNNHCDRVHMANIAQTVNVLQAMLLTDGEKMIRTPTYHVFDLYRPHADALRLPAQVEGEEYRLNKENVLPKVTVSASRKEGGPVTVSLCNLHHADAADVRIECDGLPVRQATGRVITAGELNAHNTFDRPEAVIPTPLEGLAIEDGAVRVKLPRASVAVLSLE